MPLPTSAADLLRRAAAMLAAAVAFAAPVIGQAGSFDGKVVAVVDGDTIVVRGPSARRHEIRLAGIDAPEIRQPYGVRSRSHLAELLYGRQVIVTWYKRDRYSRMLGRVAVAWTVPCGSSVCTRTADAAYAQVTAGMAWHDKQHLDEQTADERTRYARAEREARSRRSGLWAEASPMPPWRYRHLHPRRIAGRGASAP